MPYIANKSNLAQITNIHYWDSGAGPAVWSGNLIGAATPFAFLPNPVIAGDLVLFGIDSTVVDSGPFCSLVFDIGSVITDVTTILWKYSDAAGGVLPTAWAVQGALLDNTNQDGLMTGVAFDTSGIRSVHWAPNALWAVQNPTIGGVALGVTGLWLCAHVTVAGGAGVPPTQNNRDIYTITWPSVNIPEPAGDMQTLLRVRARDETERLQSRWIAGLRRTSRGADFRPFINFADEQNPLGITVTLAAGAWANDVQVPTGRKITHAGPGAAWAAYANVAFASAYSMQYKGTYRLFIRANQLAAPVGAIQMRVRQFMGDGTFNQLTWMSAEITMTTTGTYEALDMGQIHIPGPDALESLELLWFVDAYGNGAAGLDLIDLAIIPVDEWAAEVYAQYLMYGTRGTAAYKGFYVDIDDITYPKRSPRALNYPYVTGALHADPRFIGGKGGLIPNVTQNLHSITMGGTPGSWTSNPWAAESLSVWQVQRYSSMRGAR